ncbi:YadA-like family protein [Acinetobacter sp. A11]
MNKIYRLIWNEVLGIWVTASELSKAKGKRSSGSNITNVGISHTSSKVKHNQFIVFSRSALFSGALISTGAFAAGSADIGTPTVTAAIGPSNSCVSQAATNLTSAVPWTCLGQTATGGFTLINGVQANAQNVAQTNLDARASGQEAIAIGFIDTTASGTNSVAIGETANALGKNSVAIGKNITADNSDINEDLSNNVAIGSNSIASTKGSQYTIGSGGAVAIGYGEDANGVGAVAIGSSNTAEGDGAVAVGRINNAIGSGTIALGDSSSANGNRAVALGSTADAVGNAAVAIGDGVKAHGWSAIGIGRVANADADAAIALGDYAQALAFGSLAFGRESYVDTNSNESIAQGFGSSVITARNAVAIGSDATVNNRNSGIAIGDNAQVIVGSHVNDVNGLPGSIAIGLNARSVGGSEVIIGSYAAQNAQRYDDGVKNTYGSDSVMLGNQAGRNSQYLYATFIGDQAGQNSIGQHNSYVGQNAARYRTGSYNTALGSNALTGISNTTNSTGEFNTAIGTASGVNLEGNGNTLTGTYTGQRIIGNNNSAFGYNSGSNIKGNENIAIGYASGGSVQGNQNIAIGYFSGVSSQGNNNVLLGSNSNIGVNTNNVVSIGTNTRATKENSIALGANANTVSDATQESEVNLNGLTYGNFAGQVTNTGMQLSVGSAGAERQIKNVGSGAISETSTDAINGSQLYATNNILGNVANSTVDILGGDAVLNSNGTLSMSNIGGTGQNTIDSAIAASRTEVAAGTNVTDVVKTTGSNGQDIYTVNVKGSTASAGSSAVMVTAGTPDANNVTDYAVDLSQSTKDSLVKADTALQSVVTQIDGVDVKTVNKDDNKVNFVTGDNVELTANADGSITVGTSADVTFNTVNTTNLTATGETKLGDSFTVNNGGSYYTGPITEGNHITNKTYVDQATAASRTEVAAGTNVTDVVKTTGSNGQDIYTVNAKGSTASAGSSAVTVTAGTPDANNVTDYAVDLSQSTKDSLVKADTALQSVVTQIDGVDVKTVNKDDNKVNFVTGDNVELTANADGSITVGTSADVTFNTVNTTNLTATGETKLGDSFTVNNGGSYYTGPITEGNHITNKTYVDQATAASRTEVAAGTNVTDVVKTTGSNGQDIYTVNAKGSTASAGSSAVKVTAGTPDANNVTDYAVDLSQSTKDSLVKADTALQSVVTQIDGVDVKTVNKDDNKVNFVTGDNVELTANADGSITVGTSADVTFNTVNTTNLTATGETKLGDSFTVNNGGSYYTGPITEGNHITNKTYVDQATAASRTEVAAGTNVTDVVKTTGSNGQDIYTVNVKGSTASAGSSAVTVTAGTADANNVTDYAVDLSQSTKDSLVKADTALQSVVTQIDGVDVKTVNKDDNKVNFVTGDNVELTANADGSITVGTAADVTFNTVNTTNLTATGETKLGDSFTVNNGGSYYTGPITEGNHITNKTYVDQATAASRTEVAAGTNVADVVKTTGSNGQDIYTVNAKGSTASAGSSAVTVTAGTADANNVTDYAVDLSQSTKDSLVKADTALQSVVTQIDGVDVKTVNKDDNKVNFVTGDNVELTANADGSITVGTAADVTFNTVNTTNLTATGETKLGDSFTVNNGGSYYTGPITEGNHITNKTYVDQATAASRTEVEQGKNITVTSNTGVDGQNIYTVATADEVDFNKVTVGDTTITTDGIVIANGPSITKDGISAGDKKVTDVADGLISADSKDAINGSQLFGLGNNLTQLFGGNALYTNNQITWSNIGGTGQNTIDDAIKHVNDQAANANQGWNVSTDSGSNATSTVKPGQTVNINGDSDNGVLVTNSGNDIKVGLADQIKIGAGDNPVSIDGNSGTIQAGDVLIDGSKGNISAGKVTVNGEAGTVNGLTNTTWNPNNIVSGQAATEDQLQQVAQNATAAATAAKTTVSAGENITVSSSKNADGSTNYQVATSKDVKFDTVTSGSITTDKVSVGNITIDQTGINAGASKVTNVADGTINSTSKDAINGSQLHASNTNIYNYLGGGANYETNTGPTYNVGGGSYNNVGDALNSLDQQVTNVSNQLEQAFYTTNKRIDDLEDHANGGIAQAMATAGLPQAYIPGKSMMAISGGTYRGESGYAIGMSSISDNGKWVFKMSGSGNSRGDFGGTVGAGIQW